MHLFKRTSKQWFSPTAAKFLPDRHVEGTSYICGFAGARSDQCDNCGNVLEPEKLIEPRSTTGDGSLELRETEHFYLDLSKLEPEVKEFLRSRADPMRDTVLGESLGKIESEGLKPRPITRDLDGGIPVPTDEPGWETKRLYVWFEAVIGYLSAAIEWSHLSGDQQAWKAWWANPAARQFYFIGKDNIFFHTSLWPAELIGVGTEFAELFSGEHHELTLPYDVPANQFMNLEGQKISGSRRFHPVAVRRRARRARMEDLSDPDPPRLRAVDEIALEHRTDPLLREPADSDRSHGRKLWSGMTGWGRLEPFD